MLCLERRLNETIIIGDNVTVTIVDVKKDGRVKLGIEAPRDVRVDRAEIREKKERDE